MKSLSHVQLFATPWTIAYQVLPSMGFSRQEYWSGLPFPSPGYLPNPGIEPRSPTLEADALTSDPPGKSMGSVKSLSMASQNLFAVFGIELLFAEICFNIVIGTCLSEKLILAYRLYQKAGWHGQSVTFMKTSRIIDQSMYILQLLKAIVF